MHMVCGVLCAMLSPTLHHQSSIKAFGLKPYAMKLKNLAFYGLLSIFSLPAASPQKWMQNKFLKIGCKLSSLTSPLKVDGRDCSLIFTKQLVQEIQAANLTPWQSGICLVAVWTSKADPVSEAQLLPKRVWMLDMCLLVSLFKGNALGQLGKNPQRQLCPYSFWRFSFIEVGGKKD